MRKSKLVIANSYKEENKLGSAVSVSSYFWVFVWLDIAANAFL